jgi:hypothetical protein
VAKHQPRQDVVSKEFHAAIHLLLTGVELPGMTGIELSIHSTGNGRTQRS